MVFRIAIIILIFTTSLKGGVSIGMSFSEINNIINQVENIVKEKPINPTNEPTQEVWDSTTGSWVEEKINPVINGGGLNVNPADEDIDHVQDVVTTPPVVIPEEPPTSDNNGDTGDGGSGGGSGNVDTDDDVPTLLSIRSKIHTLQQEMVKQVEEVRGAERSVITNWETNETTSKRVDYGDLYAVLEKLVPDNTIAKDNFTKKKEEKDSEYESLKSDLENLKEDFTDRVESMSEYVKVKAPQSSSLNTLFELDAGNHNFYLNPFEDTYSGGITTNINWSDTADWISLIAGLVAVIIYFQAVRRGILDLMQTLIQAPMSAPVSNLSIFGNSIGTAGLMIFKIALIGSLFVSSTVFGLFVLFESNFSFGGTSQSIITVLGSITDILSGGDGFMSDAVSLLFDLLPLITMSAMFGAYLVQKLATWILLTFGITLTKAVS
jgi:hypothetical protein